MSATILGWWRPAHGCDHDDCDFAALDVAVWLTKQDDPAERLLRLAEALLEGLLNECVEEAARADMSIQGLEGSLSPWDIVEPVMALQAAIPAVLSAGGSDPDTLKLALDVWGDDLLGPGAAS
jgi:hypothetical protein